MLKNFEGTEKNGYKTDLLKNILRQISNSNEKNISFFSFKKLKRNTPESFESTKNIWKCKQKQIQNIEQAETKKKKHQIVLKTFLRKFQKR
jgi:hypothetical protein